jgi:serine/threonine protein kinase
VIKYHNKVEDNKMELAKGKRLYNKYEILKVLKAGGFGITYEAKDMELDRKVVIKEYYPSSIVNRDGTDTVMPFRTHVKIYEKGLEDFLNEAKALAKFDTNPNIVNIIEHFRANGTAYFVMPFEEGEDLARYLDKHGKMSEKEILDIIFPILNALEELHKIGMIHRDIKPANIFIRKNKSPLLIDFGTARYAFGKNSKSLTSILTAGYAPIEQYDSHSVQGAFTDIYALGATIYTMATYSVPPESTSRSLAKLNNLADPLKPISSSNFSLEFKNAVHKALNVLVKDRYQSVEEFRKALGGIKDKKKDKRKERTFIKSLLIGVFLTFGIGAGVYIAKLEKEKVAEEIRIAEEKRIAEEQRLIEINEKGNIAYNAQDYTKAFELYTKACNGNNVDGCYTLGTMYEHGEGVRQDYSRAFDLFTKACDINNTKCNNLGNMYKSGEGVLKNYDKAIELYTKACNGGNAMACNNLGNMYELGQGVSVNYPRAIELYTKACNGGVVDGYGHLGHMYQLGEGVTINYTKAIELYAKACNEGETRWCAHLKILEDEQKSIVEEQEAERQRIIDESTNETESNESW